VTRVLLVALLAVQGAGAWPAEAGLPTGDALGPGGRFAGVHAGRTAVSESTEDATVDARDDDPPETGLLRSPPRLDVTSPADRRRPRRHADGAALFPLLAAPKTGPPTV
jgi:hypothetical protein